jgi:hypothetical protein
MGATLTGVPFYRAKGYVELEAVEAPMENGLTLPIVRMGRRVGEEHDRVVKLDVERQGRE